jgi:predicted CoA-binding protein
LIEMQKIESRDDLAASESFAALDRLFYPRAVAVVGITPQRQYPNRFFLDSMKDLGFQVPSLSPGLISTIMGENNYPGTSMNTHDAAGSLC